MEAFGIVPSGTIYWRPIFNLTTETPYPNTLSNMWKVWKTPQLITTPVMVRTRLVHRTNGQNLIETPESVGFWGFLGVLSRGSYNKCIYVLFKGDGANLT